MNTKPGRTARPNVSTRQSIKTLRRECKSICGHLNITVARVAMEIQLRNDISKSTFNHLQPPQHCSQPLQQASHLQVYYFQAKKSFSYLRQIIQSRSLFKQSFLFSIFCHNLNDIFNFSLELVYTSKLCSKQNNIVSNNRRFQVIGSFRYGSLSEKTRKSCTIY